MTEQGNSLLAGVELGGTKCVCTLARSHEEVLDRAVIPTAGPEETLEAIEAVLRRWQERAPLRALGVGSFGPLDLDTGSPTHGCMAATPKPGWTGIDIAPRLRRTLGIPTAIDTDVNGAALAELRWGAGQGMRDFAYVTVGTGVGVGLIVDGRPVHGFAHPELGHIRVARRKGEEWPGSCPFHGDCVEGLASGPAIAARLGGRSVEDVPNDNPIWNEVASALAQLCHAIVCATAPRRIAIGGGVMEKQPHLLPRIESLLVESLAGYVRLPAGGAYICSPALGPMAGPLGSIALALQAEAAASEPVE